MSITDPGYLIALDEAQQGVTQGGIPVGSAIVSSNGEILGKGRNLAVQDGSVILHGETVAFEDAGRNFPIAQLKGSTVYTTLSPCPMCAGAMVYFKFKKVVIGDAKNMNGREEYLRSHGIEVVVLEDEKCEMLMSEFLANNSQTWSKHVVADT